MDTSVIPKAWWASKTIQGIVIGVAASVWRILAPRYHWADWNNTDGETVTQLLQLAGAAWTAYGLRTSSRPIGDPTKPITTPAVPAGTASGEVPVK
jgi:hypothetical protein